MSTPPPSPSHQRTYRIFNGKSPADPPRVVDVQASPDDIRFLEEEGYLIRPSVITGSLLERLRDAADELEAKALVHTDPAAGKNFGGLFIRNLIDKHPTFLQTLLKFEPLLSVARAVIGPQVQIHASVLRVAYPHLENQAVEWHFHQRVMPDPQPAFFLQPVVVDNLIYLDELTDESGPLVVLPRSHRRNEDLPSGDLAPRPGEVKVTVPAGSVVTSHSSLWHRAIAPQPTGGKRRLLILGYSPTWLKQIDRPSVVGCGGGLTDTLKNTQDAETRELLGLSGYY